MEGREARGRSDAASLSVEGQFNWKKALNSLKSQKYVYLVYKNGENERFFYTDYATCSQSLIHIEKIL